MSVDKVWPFLIEEGSIEVIEYYTSVLKTFNTEQRIKLRDKPRTIFRYIHLLDSQESALLDSLIRGNYTGNFVIPVWSESYKVDGTLLSSDTIIPSEGFSNFDGGYVFVWESRDKYVAKQVDTFNSSGVTLTEPLGEDFTRPVVSPARAGYLSESVTKDTQNLNTLVDVSFTARHNFEVDEYVGFDEFSGYPVYPFPNYNITNVFETLSQPVEYFDSGFGLVEIEPSRAFVSNVSDVNFFYQKNYQKPLIRSFLATMSGKKKPFWLPTFRKDIIPTGSGSGSSISTDTSYLDDSVVGRSIRIEQNSGQVFYNTITNLLSSSVFLSSSLPETVGPNSTRAISFMDLYRSDTDSFEFELYKGPRTNVFFTAREVTE